MTDRQNNNTALYNSTIIDTYIQFIKHYYKDIDTDNLLKKSGIQAWEVADPGHWFSQSQVDAFHENCDSIIPKDIDGVSFARQVGRFATSTNARKALRQTVLAFMTPSIAYDHLAEMIYKYSRAVEVKSLRINKNSHEIIIKYKDGLHPKPFQCENLIGLLEATQLIFASKLPKVSHPECLFSDGSCCKYILEWNIPLSGRIRRYRNILFVLFALGFPILLFFTSADISFLLSTILLFVLLSLSIYSERLANNERLKGFDRQDITPLSLIDSHCKFYNYTNILSTISSHFSKFTSVDDVMTVSTDILQDIGYKSGAIFLINYTAFGQFYDTVFSFSDSQKMQENAFSSKPINFSVLTPGLKEPIVDNSQFILDIFNDSVASFLKSKKIHDPIYVPVLYENSLLGFLILQNTRHLQSSDLNLLKTISSQIALSISNISSLNKILRSEESNKEFLTVISHEMMTPTQIVILAIHELKRLILRKENKTEFSIITKLEKAVGRLNAVLTNLMNYNKIEQFGGNLDISKTRVMEIVEAVRKETELIIERFGHRFVVEVDKNIDCLSCDRDLMIQLISNLLTNAAKYTPEKGHIQLMINISYPEYHIIVSDNGIGVPDWAKDKIFAKFYQLESNRKSEGCGFGLSFCSDIAKKHGGYITLESPLYSTDTKRPGSRFTVHLPLEHIDP